MPIARHACAAVVLLSLVACNGAPAGNELNIDNDGGGRFSGHAGMDWTSDELRAQIGGQVCGGTPPRQFDLRVLSGSWLFNGSC